VDTTPKATPRSRSSYGHCPHLPWQDKSTTTTPPRKAALPNLHAPERLRHVVPAPQSHEQLLASQEQPERTGARNHPNPYTAGGGPTSQDPEPATHTPEQATATARPKLAHQHQRDAITTFVHTLKQKPPLTRKYAVPEVGLELHSKPCKHCKVPKTCGI
jgi:hypothetical protein